MIVIIDTQMTQEIQVLEHLYIPFCEENPKKYREGIKRTDLNNKSNSSIPHRVNLNYCSISDIFFLENGQELSFSWVSSGFVCLSS